MRLAALLAAVLAFSLARASGPSLVLPPSPSWEARTDPAPPPGATAAEFFVWSKDPNVRLRVGTMAALKQDYTPAFLMELATRMGKDARAAGRTLKVTEAVTFDVGGAAVGKLHTVDGANQALLFWLPGADGDVVVTLLGVEGAWESQAEHEVTKAVSAVTGLRGAAPSVDETAEHVTTVLVVLVGVLLGAAALFAVLRRRPPAAAA